MTWAQTILVPDNCINKNSPCLVRTEEDSFMLNVSGQKIVMQKEAILRIDTGENNINFEIMDGRISLVTQQASEKEVTVNGVRAGSGRILIHRSFNRLSILNLNTYFLSEYKQKSKKSDFTLEKDEFINKLDFISFTKNYFQNADLYRTFLTAEASKWKEAFERQNNDQNKILLRRLASAREKARIDAEKYAIEEAERKKLRTEFFYRTFKR